MATIVRATVPAAEFVLQGTLDSLPGVEFETERIVESGDDAVMPLLWVRGVDADSFLAACEDDPTVDEVDCIAEFDDEQLYRMEWVDRVGLLLQMITNAEATILDAYGADDRWILRVLYPSRDTLEKTREFCSDHGLTFDVRAIREMEGEPTGRYGLTAEQYEALVTAANLGYYEIPRSVDLAEVAEQLGVSHQALSERIRRGTEALVEDTLSIGPDAERFDSG